MIKNYIRLLIIFTVITISFIFGYEVILDTILYIKNPVLFDYEKNPLDFQFFYKKRII